MMNSQARTVLDLTLPVDMSRVNQPPIFLEEEVPLNVGGKHYTAMVHRFNHDSMVSTYIDFPGHIQETSDGRDAATFPAELLYRIPSTVIRLDRENRSGPISADELKGHCPDGPMGGGMIVNALGRRRFDEIEFRTVWLAPDAVEWICQSGIHLFVSDVYERRDAYVGVFSSLFSRGIATICHPVRLHELSAPQVEITALCARFPTAMQIPCRLIAEW